MSQPRQRVATIILVEPDGGVIGRLPALPVATPWWQDMAPLVDACHERFALRPTILRLLGTDGRGFPGGAVTYLGEVAAGEVVAARAAVRPWAGVLDEQPLRMPWARMGGPAADLAWADRALAAAGRRRTADAEQIRTWNLSSIWRLPTADGPAWRKVVPPFFGHEGTLIERLAGEPVPTLLAADGGRILMPEIPGEDRYEATGVELLAMIDALVRIQVAWAGRVGELLAIGLPDWRSSIVPGAIADVVERTADRLTAAERVTLDGFVRGLPARLTAVESCGLPDTIVHGDFAPGNVRGDGVTAAMTILDWGDSMIGQPLLDQPAFLDRTPPTDAAGIRAHWDAAWRAAIPGADPTRAARLLAPIAAARQAATYRRFLDRIEPAERVYHQDDPADRLRRTSALVAAEPDLARG